jgi:hypothetical protein
LTRYRVKLVQQRNRVHNRVEKLLSVHNFFGSHELMAGLDFAHSEPAAWFSCDNGSPWSATMRQTDMHLHQTTTSTPVQFAAGLTELGPGRSKIFGNSATRSGNA